ncbi:MAG TPA: DoxX family protein [Acetobacteraceae bacterium]|nr:DoxX family protein [Acetobacteraceae bacterium]
MRHATLVLWGGRALSALFVVFMLFDVAIKLLRLPVVDEAMAQLGYPAGLGFGIGVLETVLLALYLVPRTAVLGAVLFTGVFGGAIASHLRVGDPLASHVLFGVYLGVFAWGGLWLREPVLRAVLPLRATTGSLPPPPAPR